jgi:hypothetical protein
LPRKFNHWPHICSELSLTLSHGTYGILHACTKILFDKILEYS